MSKLVELNKEYWGHGGYGHWCPGCNGGHEITVDEPNSSGAKWTFDGNLQSPTFSPSVHIKQGKAADPNYTGDHSSVCHYWITNGKIIFCADSTHSLAGKSVDLPDVPAGAYVTCKRL